MVCVRGNRLCARLIQMFAHIIKIVLLVTLLR